MYIPTAIKLRALNCGRSKSTALDLDQQGSVARGLLYSTNCGRNIQTFGSWGGPGIQSQPFLQVHGKSSGFGVVAVCRAYTWRSY